MVNRGTLVFFFKALFRYNRKWAGFFTPDVKQSNFICSVCRATLGISGDNTTTGCLSNHLRQNDPKVYAKMFVGSSQPAERHSKCNVRCWLCSVEVFKMSLQSSGHVYWTEEVSLVPHFPSPAASIRHRFPLHSPWVIRKQISIFYSLAFISTWKYQTY